MAGSGVVRRGGKKNRKFGRQKRKALRTGNKQPERARQRKIRHLMRVNGLTRAVATVVWDAGEATPSMAAEQREQRRVKRSTPAMFGEHLDD